MAQPWYDGEMPERRRTDTIRIGKRHTFVCTVPAGIRDSAPPARGTEISAIGKQGLSEGVISGIGVRVTRHWYAQRSAAKGGGIELFVEAIQLIAYS